ncbi:MAG TPA: hypothetical protein VMW16_08680 [Sedimentisphaerales bacterium]|nr:hypothetical protein [Sedimentisphaerales bacterium]
MIGPLLSAATGFLQEAGPVAGALGDMGLFGGGGETSSAYSTSSGMFYTGPFGIEKKTDIFLLVILAAILVFLLVKK